MLDFSNLREEIGSELYPYVELVHNAPGIDGATFNPATLVHAVNGLRQLGQNAALDVLRKYLTVVTGADRRQDFDIDDQRLFLILRLLFTCEAAEQRMPPLLIGAPDFEPAADDDSWPLFPLALVDDIPFLLVRGFGAMFGGAAQSPLEHLNYYAANCSFRTALLSSETSPLAAFEKLTSSEHWRRLVPPEQADGYREMLRQQAVRAEAAA